MVMALTPAEVAGLVICSFLWYWLLYRPRQRSLPPGPPGLPLLGNALQLKDDMSPWLTFTRLSRHYGDIIHFSALGQHIVVLNSATAISNLLEKRSAIYSDRPRLVMINELCGYEAFFVLSRYGRRLRQARQTFNQYIGPAAMVRWQEIQEQFARRLVAQLLESPDGWLDHVHLMVASISMKVSIGVEADSLNHPLVKLAETVVAESLQAFQAGVWLVDSIPALKHLPEWFPGAGFKKRARLWRQTMTHLRDDPYDVVKANIANGSASPSVLSCALQEHVELSPELEDVYKHVAGASYVAAVDTTRATLKWFFLAMTLHPEVQKKAQAEIDAVVEAGRLPSFSDRSQLPYVEALLKEVYRWNPVFPIGLPHRLMEDDTYGQYYIPAGATVMGNTWAVLHDPAVYPNPDQFKPERFLNSEDGYKPDPRNWAFGFGRRSCPGRYLADSTIYIAVVQILASFNIEKPLDESGNPVSPVVEYENNLAIGAPKTFKFHITPRFSDLLNPLGSV